MLALSIFTTPPPAVEKSYLVAIVAEGIISALRKSAVLQHKNTLGITTFKPVTGT